MKREKQIGRQKREFYKSSGFSGLKVSFFSFTALLLLSACNINNQIHGNLGSSTSPSVTFESLAPASSIGNSSTTFSFQLTYENVESVNLQNSYIVLSHTGTANCDSPSINNAQSMNPSLNITNCTGDGTVKVILSPGTGQSSNGTQDEGAVSLEATVDNTAPTVSVGSPSPASGDSSTNFDFPVTFSGADSINLQPSDITVNDGGGGACDTPVVTDGTTSTPTVTLSNCIGNGTVGITVNANASSDLASNQNTASSASATVSVSNSISCPTGYIPIVGNASYGTSDFCVMKYEAKVERDSDQDIHTWGCDTDLVSTTGDAFCSGVANNWVLVVPQPSTPVSVPEGRPWREIDRDEAITECQSLGAGYDLITNDEWQTIARDIELQTNNWEEGVVGGVSTSGGTDSNQLNRGHADNSPSEPLIADADDNNACIGTGQAVNPGTDDSCTGAGAGWDAEKRTHNLSNSEVIWDLAGNVWEWVKDDNASQYGTDNYFSLITAASHSSTFSLSGGTTTTARNAKDQFGPLNDYTSLTTGNRGGLGHGWINYNAGAVVRGGNWSNGTDSGVFAASLNVAPSNSGYGLGFRCVYHP